MNKYWLLVIGIFLITGCTRKQVIEPASSRIPLFDMEAAISANVPDTFIWNNLAKRIETIPLQTTDEALMSGSVSMAYFGDDCLFLVDYQTNAFFRFDRQGHLQKSYRYVGNGPGEYVRISYFFFEPEDRTIHIFDDESRKRIRYGIEGELLDETPLGNLCVPVYVSKQYMIFMGMPETDYQLYVVDSDLKELGKYFPMEEGEYNQARRSAMQMLTSRCGNKDKLLFSRPMQDTVFQVTDKQLVPSFILKKGKYDIPFNDLDRFMTKAVNSMTYLMWMQISSIPGYCLVGYTREQSKYQEMWSIEKQQIINRASGESGFRFRLPSGKEIRLPSNKMFITGDNLIFLVSAEELEGETEGVNAEDNPVLLILQV